MNRLSARLRRFGRLRQLARAGEQQAGQRLMQAQRDLAREQDRLRALADYDAAPAEGLESPPHASNRQRFAQRLRAAVAQQSQAVRNARGSVDAARDGWFGARQNTERFDAVLRRLSSEQEALDERQLMSVLDEYAARRHRRRN